MSAQIHIPGVNQLGTAGTRQGKPRPTVTSVTGCLAKLLHLSSPTGRANHSAHIKGQMQPPRFVPHLQFTRLHNPARVLRKSNNRTGSTPPRMPSLTAFPYGSSRNALPGASQTVLSSSPTQSGAEGAARSAGSRCPRGLAAAAARSPQASGRARRGSGGAGVTSAAECSRRRCRAARHSPAVPPRANAAPSTRRPPPLLPPRPAAAPKARPGARSRQAGGNSSAPTRQTRPAPAIFG